MRQTHYDDLIAAIARLDPAIAVAHLRNLARTDLYFLLRYALNRPDVEHPWLFDRIREVQQSPDGYVDLWARDHYKSTIITYAKTIQDLLASHGNDPLPQYRGKQLCIGIFSHTRPIAKGFLRQIKREYETNTLLREWFPDIIWDNPQADAPKWSEDDGIILKRSSNPKEATLEAWGLVDGQPISRHYDLLIYDDVVTRDSVNTPDMIKKTTEAWELSLNLGSRNSAERYIGTRYHARDTYHTIITRKAGIERRYPATADGTEIGAPVLLTAEALAKKRQSMGAYTFAAQMLQNPLSDKTLSFRREDLRFSDIKHTNGLNKYLICDPANGKKKTNDYTAMAVIGLGADNNYYVLDMIYDRLSLTERTEALIYLHKRWKPKRVGYEKYGKDADIDHIKYVQADQNYRFDITELGGGIAKYDRIIALSGVLSANRLYLPKQIIRKDYNGKYVDVVEQFLVEEYDTFPAANGHDDMLDCIARILDPALAVLWPKLDEEPTRYKSDRSKPIGKSWKTA